MVGHNVPFIHCNPNVSPSSLSLSLSPPPYSPVPSRPPSLSSLLSLPLSPTQAHSDRVDMLNRRTEQAAASVHGGVVNLQGGQRLKGYVLPVGGAIVGGVLGGVVGGPVGAVAGLKIGALAAATAGTAGVLGGAFIGYRVNKSNAEATRRENANSPPTAPTTPPTASHRKAD